MSDTDKDLKQATKALQDNLKDIEEKEKEATANMIKKLNTVASNVEEETKNSDNLIEKIDKEEAEEAERRKREEEEKDRRKQEQKKFLMR